MNKRSAIAVALGLVAALVAGGVALSVGLGEAGTAAQAASVRTHQKPKIRTIRRTIKVHRKADGSNGGGTVVVRSGSQGQFSSGSSDGSGFTGEDSSDDSFESDDSGTDTEDSTDDSTDDSSDDGTDDGSSDGSGGGDD